MLTVSRECRFDAAHLLTDHAGLCRHLHGHTYRVVAEVAGAADSGDMVMDFKEIKHVLRDVIVEPCDHAFIFNRHSPVESDIAAVIAKHGMRTLPLDFQTTAENLARHFFRELARRMNVVSVKVFETPESCATYRSE